MTYTYAVEQGQENLEEMMPLYEAHYAETSKRLSQDGVDVPEWNPRVDHYKSAWESGWLINYVVRKDGEPVGAANVYVTHSAHNRTLLAVEDSIYVLPEHRGRVGRELVKFALADLKERGVRQVMIDAVTDLRVAKIWKRMGFKEYAVRMVYDFEEN